MAGVKYQVFPLTFNVVLITLWQYRDSVRLAYVCLKRQCTQASWIIWHGHIRNFCEYTHTIHFCRPSQNKVVSSHFCVDFHKETAAAAAGSMQSLSKVRQS